MLNTSDNDLVGAVHDMTAGIDAMVWALENGYITKEEYAAIEDIYDNILNKVSDFAWKEVLDR